MKCISDAPGLAKADVDTDLGDRLCDPEEADQTVQAVVMPLTEPGGYGATGPRGRRRLGHAVVR